MRTNRKRLFITLLAVAVGISQIKPWKDIAFDQYLTSQVKANEKQFQTILEEAQQNVLDKKSPHLMSAILSICQRENVDLSKIFTNFNVADVKSIDKKNQILLRHMLSRSQSVFKQGLDLKGGVAFSLEINPKVFENKSDKDREAMVQKAMEIISSRINALGMAEPSIRSRGYSSIEVQLPGISLKSNPELVRALKKPAKLELRLVSDDDLDQISPLYEKKLLPQEDSTGKEIEIPIWVKRIPELIGKDIKVAYPQVDTYGRYEIRLQMNDSGRERFAVVTRNNLNRRLAIVLDGKVCSAPVIQTEIITGEATITGNFTQRDAIELSNALNNPLEFEMELIEIYEVGPSLASSAKVNAIQASLIGLALILLLMVFYYRWAGIISGLTLVLNFIFIIASWAILGATITLPSITALALTFGMAVDANILIFERVREEVKNGHDHVVAFDLGHKRAFLTIFDANITTLVAAVMLIWLGTGSVRGFGITLCIGVLTTLFTVLYFSKVILEVFARKGWLTISKRAWLGNVKFDFVSCKKPVFWISFTLFSIGVLGFWIRGKNVWSIDFAGGDEILLSSEIQIDCQKIRDLAKTANLGEVNAVYQKNSDNEINLLKIQTKKDHGVRVLKKLQEEFPDAKLQCLSQNQIGASISSAMKRNAILSVVGALTCILMYVVFRFEFTYGVSSVFALIHDILITIGMYVALGCQFSSPMVAAVLMVIGYSINDTIIIFDRIREELKLHEELTLLEVINNGISKTLSRTIMTSLTTFIPAMSLYIMCTGVVKDYALVFMLGVIIGTFSSIFIAPIVFCKLNKGNRPVNEKSDHKGSSGDLCVGF